MKSPVGKYFKTDYAHFYCFREHSIGIVLSDRSQQLKRSTRKAFMKAYSRTLEKINEIVEAA